LTFSINVIVTHSIDMSQKVTNALKCLVTARAGKSTSSMLLRSGDMGRNFENSRWLQFCQDTTFYNGITNI
jgi:hypothetical protein